MGNYGADIDVPVAVEFITPKLVDTTTHVAQPQAKAAKAKTAAGN